MNPLPEQNAPTAQERIPMATSKLIAEIKDYIGKNGGMLAGYGWYVGITSDPDRRLFRDHQVDKQNGPWIHGAAASNAEARSIERQLMALGCKGGSGGGDAESVYVYAYRINMHTKE